MATATARAARVPARPLVVVPAATPPAPEGPTEPTTPPAAVTSIHRRLALEPLPEPVELLSRLRSLGADRPASSRSTAPSALADWACQFWADSLKDLGVGHDVVEAAFESCRREIWLWVTGDRRWSQLSTWLAARVARRAEATG
ncbi:MAG TPA: hypothetical protein VGP46_03485 [Acidimicrobiales bacterium]|jgi:hypothetical protein|nr:hypothetical protein [Acidimicrobiales bacterium]